MDHNSVQFVVLSRGEGLYEIVCREIGMEHMNASVKKACSIREAASLVQGGMSVLVTDKETFPFVIQYIEGEVADEGSEIMPEKRNSEEIVDFIRYFVRMHLNEELNLERIARIIGLSRNYLCTLFHKETGISLRRFIEKSRLEKAAYILETEGALVCEIADRVGIPNPSYFCKMFKRFYGETPRRYRALKRMQKEG